ncbi:MAG: citrate lyase beta subunit [Motiliproteus sp.]|jgi:citrate lyase beta subunit
MNPPISYFQLGATLYTPCTHPRLSRVMQHGILGARSIVFCTEDAINDSELSSALENLKESLKSLSRDRTLLRFIRPRNIEVLAEILAMEGIDKIDGFVIPKADSRSLPGFKRLLSGTDVNFSVMPTLESVEVLDPTALPHIRKQLAGFDNVLCLRIGGNDLMNLMGLKRLPGMTAYETPLRTIIDQLVIAFRPYGFELSAPVFDFIDDRSTLISEIKRDISYGLLNKTAIHPSQINIIQNEYVNYTEGHVEKARELLKDNVKAVFRLDGQMLERTCHSNWAKRTLLLANNFYEIA